MEPSAIKTPWQRAYALALGDKDPKDQADAESLIRAETLRGKQRRLYVSTFVSTFRKGLREQGYQGAKHPQASAFPPALLLWRNPRSLKTPRWKTKQSSIFTILALARSSLFG